MKKFLFGILSFVCLVLLGTFGGQTMSSSVFATADEIVLNVGSADEFVNYFTTQSTFDNPNVVVRLSGPIDFAGVDLSPIAQEKNTFMGTFDGNGYTISNPTFKSKISYYGLIPYAKEATIQNLRVSGNVEFDFEEENIQEIFAGVLLGAGENVVIKNCELDNAIVEGENVTYDSINLPVNSNTNFGFLAGKLKGNKNASNQTMPANIIDCVNYYDANVVVNKFATLSFGGLVGNVENCYLLDNMNFGDIVYSQNSSLSGTNSHSQYFGGIAGQINGGGQHIRNCIFGGEISAYEDVELVNEVIGAIVGSTISTSVNSININFDYYTQSSLSPSGDGSIARSEKVDSVEALTKSFLLVEDKFDRSVKGWDFDDAWILLNSKFHNQTFQMFEYNFNGILDRGQILESAVFCEHGSQSGSEIFNAKHGLTLDIRLSIKEEYRGFYYMNESNAFMLLNNNQFMGEYQLEEIEDAGKIAGYVVSIKVNATTAGTYSFVVSQKTYNCVVSVSDEAKANSQGGVRVVSTSSQNSAISEFDITFAHNSDAKQIIAESTKNSIYTFDYWELYYKNDQGEFSELYAEFDQKNSNVVTIAFGSAPFDQEFKLVAYFTDAEAILFDFGEIDNTYIKSVRVADVEYQNQPIPFAATRVLQIEVVTAEKYVLQTEKVVALINELYADNPSPYPVEKEPMPNEDGGMTYIFTIDLNYAKNNILNNQLAFELSTEEDKGDNNSYIIWILVAIGVVVLAVVATIIIVVVRKRNGGGRSGGRKMKVKEKRSNYKDYYI